MSKKRKILFVDRDGTLIEEPADEQIDSLEKLALIEGVIPALLQLQEAGYELVIVSNQDGLGTASFPEPDFIIPQEKMLALFSSQGIEFSAIHIDPHFPEDGAFTRKPQIGMVLDYLKSGSLDLDNSYVIGDRKTDLELAKNMGITGIRVGERGQPWLAIADGLINKPRSASCSRSTRETRITATVNLDQPGVFNPTTGIGFFDHMLEQLALHGGFSLTLNAQGDLHIDEHHTVEDCALVLGEAVLQALGDKRGIGRYGFTLPMDESLATVAVDLSGRPAFAWAGDLPRDAVGGLSVEMVKHFFASLAQSLAAAVHIQVSGDNTHHMVESVFKCVGQALKPALARTGHELPSSKGVL